MPSIAKTVYWALVVAWGASLYQIYLKDLFTITFGVGRVIQSIDEFPEFNCRRLVHPRLEACEDIWLDNEGRTLYAACAGTAARLAWNQAMNDLNVTGRRPGGSELLALDIDEPGEDGLYNLRSIKPIGHYKGADGSSDLDLLGFDVQVLDDNTIRFYFVNQRPPVDASNKIVDASESGANSTVEIFEMRKGQEQMRHVRTVFSDQIWTPNRVAALGDGSGGFLVTNDHSVKVGMRLGLDFFIGGGNVAYCDGAGKCHAAYDGSEERQFTRSDAPSEPKYNTYLNKALSYLPKTKLKFPNGLALGRDGLFYIPSTIDGQIRVLALQPDKTLSLVDTIHVGMPLDNISPDANGDMYVAGFPNLYQSMKGFDDPYNGISPVTIWRIRKTVDVGTTGVRSVDYRVEKVIEDKDAKVLSGSTTVRHDVKTGRLFISAAVHPFLVVCEPTR